jgi:hypothetical protein
MPTNTIGDLEECNYEKEIDSLSISRIQTSSLINYSIDKIFNATCQRHAKVDD